MKYFRSKRFSSFFSSFLIILIINVSIDPPDALKNLDDDFFLEEDLSINEMESISEIVLEGILEMEDAVPEKDDFETDGILKKNIFYLESAMGEITTHIYRLKKNTSPFFSCKFFSSSILDYTPPPEKS